jgi:small subunit ribosomal protein S8
MSNDTISDFLTRLRNAQLAGHKTVTVPSSKIVESIVAVLQNEGYLSSVDTRKNDSGFSLLEIGIKYYDDGKPVLTTLKRVSKPGCRIYSQVSELGKVNSGLGLSLVSTSQGVMTDREARKRNLGGEVLATIG